jgi:TIR domain
MSTERNANRAHIYVSFADEDRARAMELVRWLNDSGWRVVADDRHSFAPGETWSAPRRLQACDVILCVITPGWLVSTYCHREFTWCAKRGKFVLPVVCEPFDVDLLPPAIRVLPRIDFTHSGMIDYLALKQALTQTGTQASRAARVEAARPADRLRRRHRLWLLLAVAALLALAAITAAWVWLRR